MPNRPPRCPEFDYLGQVRYFLTVCVKDRQTVFLDPALARFVNAQFLILARTFGFAVIAYCVMPDHFHALVEGTAADAALKRFMKRWKQATGFQWKRQGHRDCLWQEGYFDHILREGDQPERVARYIIANPVRAGLVEDVRQYPFVGSPSYSVEELLEWTLDWKPPWK